MILYRKNIAFSWEKQRFYTIKAMLLKEKKNFVVFCVPQFLMIKDSKSISKRARTTPHIPFLSPLSSAPPVHSPTLPHSKTQPFELNKIKESLFAPCFSSAQRLSFYFIIL